MNLCILSKITVLNHHPIEEEGAKEPDTERPVHLVGPVPRFQVVLVS